MIRAEIWSICDQYQTALKPWHDAGYSVASIGIEDTSGSYPHIKARVQDIETLNGARFVLAWPPCTHLAASGGRWWARKGEQALREGLENVEQCRRLIGLSPGIIENPIGRLSTHWRKPDVIVQPWHFSGHAPGCSYQKSTCLWLMNSAKRPIMSVSDEPIDTKVIWHMSGQERSTGAGIKTPLGLAIGVYLANESLVRHGR